MSAETSLIRILVADDHPLCVRMSLGSSMVSRT
jgi:hypothetical protein